MLNIHVATWDRHQGFEEESVNIWDIKHIMTYQIRPTVVPQ